MVIAEERRRLLQSVVFWLTMVALTVALVYLIRSDHKSSRDEVYFFLRTIASIVIFYSITWAIKVRRSRVK
jgi:Ca2+/Na+ antiporter